MDLVGKGQKVASCKQLMRSHSGLFKEQMGIILLDPLFLLVKLQKQWKKPTIIGAMLLLHMLHLDI